MVHKLLNLISLDIFLIKMVLFPLLILMFTFFSSVLPGETRISDGTVDFNFGLPVYFALSAKY